MNRLCAGRHFKIDGIHYYRCAWDSSMIQLNSSRLPKLCYRCARPVAAGKLETGDLRTQVVTYVTAANGHQFEFNMKTKAEAQEALANDEILSESRGKKR